MIVDRDEHGVGLRAIDLRIGRQRFLDDLVEIGLDAVERDAVARRARDQGGHQGMRRRVADEAEAEGDERRQGAPRGPRPLDRLGKAGELVLVERGVGERLQAAAEIALGLESGTASRREVVGRRRKPGEIGVKASAHRAITLSIAPAVAWPGDSPGSPWMSSINPTSATT